MLNKSYSLSRYKENTGRNEKNVRCFLTLMLGSLSLTIDTGYDFAINFLQ